MNFKNLLYLVFIATSTTTYAQNSKQRQQHFNTDSQHVMIDGFDPVSYFNGTPMQGKAELNYAYMGVTYWFSSTINRTIFINSPEKYEPQYGGWCAYAIGHNGEKVKVDPKTFKIAEGKLYLFYNFYLTNTLKMWNKEEDLLMINANKNWISITE